MQVSTLISRAQTAILVLSDPALTPGERADLMETLTKIQKKMRLEYVVSQAKLKGLRQIVASGEIPSILQEAGVTLASIQEDIGPTQDEVADMAHLLNQIGLILTFAR